MFVRRSLRLGLSRLLTAALLAGLTYFAFEEAVHSVHHLGEPEEAAACAIALVATNLAGAVGERPFIAPSLAASQELVPGPVPPGPFVRIENPDHGRAPPAPG